MNEWYNMLDDQINWFNGYGYTYSTTGQRLTWSETLNGYTEFYTNGSGYLKYGWIGDILNDYCYVVVGTSETYVSDSRKFFSSYLNNAYYAYTKAYYAYTSAKYNTIPAYYAYVPPVYAYVAQKVYQPLLYRYQIV